MTNSPIHYEENIAYNKPFLNNLVVSKTHKGNDMDKKNCNYLETKQQGMTITFVLPAKNKKEECTKNEIKNILTNVLQQYLTKEVFSYEF